VLATVTAPADNKPNNANIAWRMFISFASI
jgi:hypothetical protein